MTAELIKSRDQNGINIRIIVRMVEIDAWASIGLRCLGYKSIDPHTFAIDCRTPAAVDAARNPLHGVVKK